MTHDPYPEADVLLIADPVKPRGTGLGPDELSAVLAWLEASPHRRVLIDVVYALGPFLPLAVQRLIETDQAIVLHSLSKGWITAEVFGVAMVPEQDVALWTPVFRALPTLFADDRGDGQAHERRLKTAQLCLSPAYGAGFPQHLAQAMRKADQALDRALQAHNVRAIGSVPGVQVPRYLRAVPYPVETLRRQHGILGLPLSTFGSTNSAWSVVTALPWMGEALAQPPAAG